MYNENVQVMEVLMKNKKEKTEVKTDEEKYLYAKDLTNAVSCLIREKDKAEIYEGIAKIYEELGEYQDVEVLREQAKNAAKKHRELAKEQDAKAMEIKPDTEEKKGSRFLGKIIFVLILIVILAGIGGVVYLKSEAGRYARADYYEKKENYEKSYKMFHNLKDYKDSKSRSTKSYYEYGLQCKENNEYTKAKDILRELDDYKDSKDQLTELELDNIRQSETGTSVLYGEYKWLIVEKEEDKVFLVKSEPINGYAYHNQSKKITWADCSLREYLNSDFIEETFYKKMSDRILDTKIKAPDNKKYNTKGGRETTDKIFLLNAKQAKEYKQILDNFSRDWWLISPGNSQNTAQYVSYGVIMDYGYEVSNANIHIRPAMWITVK